MFPPDAVLLDVREDDEWAAGRAPGAVHVPMTQMAERLDEVPDGDPVYVICRSGGRSARVTAYLNSQGWDSVNVAGGMGAGRRPAGRWSPTATPPPRSSDHRHDCPPRSRSRPSHRCADDDRPRLRAADRPPAGRLCAVRTVPRPAAAVAGRSAPVRGLRRAAAAVGGAPAARWSHVCRHPHPPARAALPRSACLSRWPSPMVVPPVVWHEIPPAGDPDRGDDPANALRWVGWLSRQSPRSLRWWRPGPRSGGSC